MSSADLDMYTRGVVRDLFRGSQSIAHDRANEAISQTLEHAAELTALSAQLANIPNVNVGGMLPVPNLEGFESIPNPVTPDMTMAFPVQPAAPTIDAIAPINPGRPPEFVWTPPVIANIPAPSPLDVDGPGSAPTISEAREVAVPTMPIPSSPALAGMEIPIVPNLDLRLFTEPFPVHEVIARDVNFGMDLLSVPNRPMPQFDFVGLQTIHQQTVSACSAIFNGDRTMVFRLFPSINDAALQRARDRSAANDLLSEQAILNGSAGRGFSRPPGSTAALLRRSRESRMARDAAVVTEMMIQEVKDEREDMRFVMELVNQTTEKMLSFETILFDRAVTFQKNVLDASIAFFNYQKERIQLQVSLFEAARNDARDKITMALSTLEHTKVQLETARLVGVLNDQILKKYQSDIQAVESAYGLYQKQLEGEKTRIATDQIRMEAFAHSVTAFEAQVRAKSLEYTAFAEMLRGEGMKADVFGKMADAYRSATMGYEAVTSAQSKAQDTELKRQELKLAVYRTNLDAFNAGVQKESKRPFIPRVPICPDW